MLQAFLAEHKTVLFAHDLAEASERLKVWSSLADALGHRPGGGRVNRVPDERLDHNTARELEQARLKDAKRATPVARERAVRALATHLPNGDLEEARNVIETIERESGQLPDVVANWIVEAPREQAQ